MLNMLKITQQALMKISILIYLLNILKSNLNFGFHFKSVLKYRCLRKFIKQISVTLIIRITVRGTNSSVAGQTNKFLDIQGVPKQTVTFPIVIL